MSDADWVEDVRRWYFSGRDAIPGTCGVGQAAPTMDGEDALGYEAADPALQARNWPDAALVSAAPSVARAPAEVDSGPYQVST